MGNRLSQLINLIIIWLAIGSCTPGEEKLKQPSLVIPPLKVKAVTVNPKPLAHTILAEGVIKSEQRQPLISRRTGIVKQTWYYAGDRVQEGDTLVMLENEEEFLDLRFAYVNLMESSYTYESELMSFRYTEALTDTIRKSILYSSGKAAAEIRYRQREIAYEKTFIISDVTGLLSGFFVKPGMRVVEGESLGTIYSPDKLEVEAHLLEIHAGKVFKGMQVEVCGMRSERGKGIIKYIDPEIDKDGFFKIVADISGSGFIPGMHVGVSLYSNTHEGLAIPAKAIIQRGDRLMVFVQRQGVTEWRYITTGLQMEDQVEILEGLNSGDTVIVNKLVELDHGIGVEVLVQPAD
jgi:RND family efflux transporter MFP subunit